MTRGPRAWTGGGGYVDCKGAIQCTLLSQFVTNRTVASVVRKPEKHLAGEASGLGFRHPRCADDGVHRVAVQSRTPSPGDMELSAGLGEPSFDEVSQAMLPSSSSRQGVAHGCAIGHLAANQSPIVACFLWWLFKTEGVRIAGAVTLQSNVLRGFVSWPADPVNRGRLVTLDRSTVVSSASSELH